MTVPFSSGDFRRITLRPPPPLAGVRWRGARMLRRRPGAVLVAAATVLSLVVTAGVLLASRPDVEAPAEEPRIVLAPPVWTSVPRPQPAFALETTAFADRAALEVRVHGEGGGREDIFSFSSPGQVHGFASLVAYRPGAEAGPQQTFYLAFARRAAEAGFALARSAVPQPLPTKFGPAEAADVVFSDGQTQHACIAWRLDADAAELRLSGWTCAGPAQQIDRRAVACLVERLELAPGNGDRGLRAVFQAADRQRLSGCPPAPVPPKPVAAQRRPA